MAQFTFDLAAASGSADITNPTGISGITIFADTGSEDYQDASIVTDATAISGKVLRWDDIGWGGGFLLSLDAVGNMAANQAVEVLVSFKVGAFGTDKGGHFHTVGPIIRALSGLSKFSGIGLRRASGVADAQGWYFQSVNDWVNFGSAKTLTGFAAGQYWWFRMQVTAAGDWSWKVWQDGTSEPGSWDVTGVNDTSQTSGYVGVGGIDNTPYGPVDVQWLSVGTAGDPAPAPSGGPISITPQTGTLTLTGAAPNVARTAISPGTAALTLTGQAPQITSQFIKTPTSASLVISGNTPLVQILGTIRPDTGQLTINGNAPVATQAHIRTPASGSLVLTGTVPTLNGSRTLQPAGAALTITGYTASQTLTIPSPGSAALVITGYAPVIPTGIIRTPTVGSLTIAGQTPKVTQTFSLTPGSGSLVLTGYAPGSSGITIRPTAAGLTIVGQLPFVQGVLTRQPASGTLSITGIAPVLSGQNIIRPGVGSLAISGIAPVIKGDLGRTPGSGSLSISGVAPTVRVPIFITPPSGELVISGQLSPSAGTGGGDGTDGGSGLVQRHAARAGLRRPIRYPIRAFNA